MASLAEVDCDDVTLMLAAGALRTDEPAVRAHLAECESCSQLATTDDPPPPRPLWRRVLARASWVSAALAAAVLLADTKHAASTARYTAIVEEDRVEIWDAVGNRRLWQVIDPELEGVRAVIDPVQGRVTLVPEDGPPQVRDLLTGALRGAPP